MDEKAKTLAQKYHGQFARDTLQMFEDLRISALPEKGKSPC